MALDAASNIVAQDGLRGLSTRRIAKEIGYTAGTLYQLFDDLDDLIEQMNGDTLTDLYEACKNIDPAAGPAESLKELSRRYIRYTRAHSRLWAAIIEHQLPYGRDHSERYLLALHGLLGLVETAIAPFFANGDDENRLHHARLLWASYFGIHALAVTRNLAKSETVESMANTLFEVHLIALQAAMK